MTNYQAFNTYEGYLIWVIFLYNESKVNDIVLKRKSSDYLFFCIPDGVTLGQERNVIKKYLENHPENRHEAARFISTLAFKEVWPCK